MVNNISVALSVLKMSGRHMQGKKFLQKKTEIKTCLQSKGYIPPESVQNSNADQRQLEYPIPPL